MDFQDDFRMYLLVEKGYSANTYEGYCRDLEKLGNFFSDKGKSLPDLSRQDIFDFIVRQGRSGYSKKSISRAIASFRTYYKFLLREKIIDENPVRDIEIPKDGRRLPDVFSVEEIIRIIEAPGGRLLDIRDRAVMEVLYATGMRVSELTGLELKDYDSDMQLIRCFGKGSKERIVPVGKTAAECLAKYLDEVRHRLLKDRTEQKIFLNFRGGGISRQGVWKIISKYGEKVVPGRKMHPHVFRHSCATHMLENGADLRTVQEMLGHVDISSTQIYTHVAENTVLGEYYRYHPRGNKKGEC